ncbi:MAG TPA: hypothetical protein VGM87_01255 [Roseomonas sp.]
MKSLTLFAALAAMTVGVMPLAEAHGAAQAAMPQHGILDAGRGMAPDTGVTTTWQQFQPPSYGRFLAQQYNTDSGA